MPKRSKSKNQGPRTIAPPTSPHSLRSLTSVVIQKASLGCLAAGTGHRVYPDRAQRTEQADERQRRAAANFVKSASDLILGS